jgi:seryl-tRNA synthetase
MCLLNNIILHTDPRGNLRIQRGQLRPLVERVLVVKAARRAKLSLALAATSCTETRYLLDYEIEETDLSVRVLTALLNFRSEDGSVPVTTRLLHRLEEAGRAFKDLARDLAQSN